MELINNRRDGNKRERHEFGVREIDPFLSETPIGEYGKDEVLGNVAGFSNERVRKLESFRGKPWKKES